LRRRRDHWGFDTSQNSPDGGTGRDSGRKREQLIYFGGFIGANNAKRMKNREGLGRGHNELRNFTKLWEESLKKAAGRG